MATATNFDAWLDDVDGDYEEVMALYDSVQNVSDMGLYQCVEGGRGDAWVVSSTFLKLIRERLCGGEDVDSWYGFQRNISNDHS